MSNIMLDLETLGTSPGCVVFSIGAVKFDLLGAHSEFYRVVNIPDSITKGFSLDQETMDWWKDQDIEARRTLDDAWGGGTTVEAALNHLTAFIDDSEDNRTKVWGNGSDFDNTILATYYKKLGLELPWKFYNNKCYRTVRKLLENAYTQRIQRTGVSHNALDDARNQARHLIYLMQLHGKSL